MKRQIKQPKHLLPLVPVPVHKRPGRVGRVHGLAHVRDVAALRGGLRPQVRVRVQVGQDELQRRLAAPLLLLLRRDAVGGVVEVALDGGRGPTAAGAKVDEDVGGQGGEVGAEEVGDAGGWGGGLQEGDLREGGLDN